MNIIGNPNVGKSTLMNALVGERLSIITNKPQTTRHRIMGILNDENYQIVFSDTPGFISEPAYKMQESMNSFVVSTFDDADVLLLITDTLEKEGVHERLKARLAKLAVPLIILINKIDLSEQVRVKQTMDHWISQFPDASVIPISALEKVGIDAILKEIYVALPEGPEYYPKDQLTDKSERFFVSEIIREKILLQYHQEIPYSTEVIIDQFKHGKSRDGAIVRISADIIVGRKTQKSIMIGKGGAKIKKLGTESRKQIETFLGEKVFLELRVKVKENWRDDERTLKYFGYKN